VNSKEMNSRPLRSTGKEYSDKVFMKFWRTMSAIFLGKWTSQVGTTPNAIWIKGLGDLSADEIATGLNGIEVFGRKSGGWPPNMIEFRDLCKPIVPTTPACHRPFPRLPAPKCDPDVARMHTQGILAKLKCTQSPTRHAPESDAEWMQRRQRQDAAIVSIYGSKARIDCSLYHCAYHNARAGQ